MHVLIIEDSKSGLRQVERVLGDQVILSRASTLAHGLELAARKSIDLVILNIALKESAALAALEKARAALSNVPVLLLSEIECSESALAPFEPANKTRSAKHSTPTKRWGRR